MAGQVSRACFTPRSQRPDSVTQEETSVIAQLTGFSLDNVLTGLDLPSGPGLSNQLGISGVPSFTKNQIYGERWDDEEAIGPGQGEDFEDEVNRELEQEEEEEEDGDAFVKEEVVSPRMARKEKRTKTIVRRVERPKTVYERFPTFEKDRVLDFTELFKGYTVPRSRISKRYFTGKQHGIIHVMTTQTCHQWNRPIRNERSTPKASSRLS